MISFQDIAILFIFNPDKYRTLSLILSFKNLKGGAEKGQQLRIDIVMVTLSYLINRTNMNTQI